MLRTWNLTWTRRSAPLFIGGPFRRTCRLSLPPLDLQASGSAPRITARPLAWQGCLRFPADRVYKSVLEAMMPGGLGEEEASELPIERSAARYSRVAVSGRRDRLEGSIGFHLDPGDASGANSALRVKLQWALWSRAFVETGGRLESETEVTLSQLCDDLGYARLANGSHRPSTKRLVTALLEQLACVKLDLHYRAPDGRTTRLTGRLWELELRPDVTPSVRYRPAAWFFDPVWSQFNNAVGLAPAELMELRPDRDAWAIRIGSYLAVLARMNGYRPLTLRLQTLMEKTGLAAAEHRNPARMHEKLGRALERLEESGCVSGWDWAGEGPAGEPDMDAPKTLSELSRAADDQRDQKVIVYWPQALRARETALESARRQHTAGRRRRSAVSKPRI